MLLLLFFEIIFYYYYIYIQTVTFIQLYIIFFAHIFYLFLFPVFQCTFQFQMSDCVKILIVLIILITPPLPPPPWDYHNHPPAVSCYKPVTALAFMLHLSLFSYFSSTIVVNISAPTGVCFFVFVFFSDPVTFLWKRTWTGTFDRGGEPTHK